MEKEIERVENMITANNEIAVDELMAVMNEIVKLKQPIQWDKN